MLDDIIIIIYPHICHGNTFFLPHGTSWALMSFRGRSSCNKGNIKAFLKDCLACISHSGPLARFWTDLVSASDAIAAVLSEAARENLFGILWHKNHAFDDNWSILLLTHNKKTSKWHLNTFSPTLVQYILILIPCNHKRAKTGLRSRFYLNCSHILLNTTSLMLPTRLCPHSGLHLVSCHHTQDRKRAILAL